MKNFNYLKSRNQVSEFDSIRSNLAMKMYDAYVNVLGGMYIVRFNGSVSVMGTWTGVG